MRARSPIAAFATLGLVACGGGPGSASPAALAYSMPSMASVQYLSGDTTQVDVDAMGQSLQISMENAATYDVAFSDAADGVDVSMTVSEYSARMSQPMAGPVTADESGISGALAFNLSRRGDVTVSSTPTVSGNAAQTFTPNSMAYSFFPGLPGTAASVGDMWTDTVSWSGPEGQGEVDAQSVVDYTIVGDTAIAGRSLLNIAMEGLVKTETSVNMGGMDIVQTSEISLTGTVLWDVANNLMFEMHTRGAGTGAAGTPMGDMAMSLRTVSHIRLKDGM